MQICHVRLLRYMVTLYGIYNCFFLLYSLQKREKGGVWSETQRKREEGTDNDKSREEEDDEERMEEEPEAENDAEEEEVEN